MIRVRHLVTLASSAVLLAAVHSTALAQAAAPVARQAARADTTHRAKTAHPRRRPRQAALRAQAKITEDSARKIALGQVPGGTVQKVELEREHGRLVYSLDVKAEGKPGMEEVNVDALDGRVVATEHESAAAEKREEKAEKKDAARPHAAKTSAAMKAKPDAARKP